MPASRKCGAHPTSAVRDTRMKGRERGEATLERRLAVGARPLRLTPADGAARRLVHGSAVWPRSMYVGARTFAPINRHGTKFDSLQHKEHIQSLYKGIPERSLRSKLLTFLLLSMFSRVMRGHINFLEK